MKNTHSVVLGLSVSFLFVANASLAARLQDSKYYEYDVRFTNPVCETYTYDEPVRAEDGTLLKSKPKNAYCKSSDSARSAERDTSVQSKLIEWIRSPKTKEIFFAYLSFSNSVIGEELCNAVKERSVKIRFVLDSGTDTAKAKALLACKPASGRSSDKPEMLLRGNTSGIGYAHNKIMLFNPQSSGEVRLVFSSGNLSSGVVVHHENWHFIKASADTNFIQSHLCLMNGMIDHAESASQYKSFIASCRSEIESEVEEDIQTFFVPGEGEEASQAIKDRLFGNRSLGISAAKHVSVAAHRFSYTKLIDMLGERLDSGRTRVELVTDDDTYWVGTTGEQVGSNMIGEYRAIQKLTKKGMYVKWLETNHGQKLLHHNKFIIFDDEAVFAGAGNLTGDAFTKNFENFYMIQIPEVVSRFRKQYDYLYGKLATESSKMPVENILP